jgi:hypothetical protein
VINYVLIVDTFHRLYFILHQQKICIFICEKALFGFANGVQPTSARNLFATTALRRTRAAASKTKAQLIQNRQRAFNEYSALKTRMEGWQSTIDQINREIDDCEIFISLCSPASP